MLTKRHTLATLLLATPYFLICQTDQENLERYWKYKDRLLTEFMKVDADQGGSIPMNKRWSPIPGWRGNMQIDSLDANGESVEDADGNNIRLRWQGDILRAGDATVYLGHYLAVLGTEWELLLRAV